MTSAPVLPDGWTLVALQSVGSTNDEAARLAEAGAPEGTVVWAREQTGGRGRRGRAWASPLGNLYSSTILRPGLPGRAGGRARLRGGAGGGRHRAGRPRRAGEMAERRAGRRRQGRRHPARELDRRRTARPSTWCWASASMSASRPSLPEMRYPGACLGGTVEAALERLTAALARRLAPSGGATASRRCAREWLAKAGPLGLEVDVKLGDELVRGRFAGMDRRGRLAAGYRRRPAPDRGRRVAGPRGLKENEPCCSPSTSATPTSKFAVFDGDEIVGAVAPAHRGQAHADEYAVWLTQLMHLQGFDPQVDHRRDHRPASCRRRTSTCAACARRYFNCEPLVVGEPDVELGIKVLIDRPQDAGADRVWSTRSARHHVPRRRR